MSKESVQILIENVESIERDFESKVDSNILSSTIESSLMTIKLAKTNPNNNEETLNDLELRLSRILSKLY
ncbi:hypothetical protein [Flavobacterium aquicola]|uniref:Uncharacterized protein n=1 Tax=Flavobacterium aquicola TaxID=1682742 RepID=A0A3E0ERN0_9FLAO|nr:hypothetical protein [Flavobacterium aquicola]REH00905.1 hypothetical protein C8P67_102157 [Flavobacterium aquicola]